MKGKRTATDWDREIGWRLHLARLRADVKQVDAARHIGTTSEQMRKYEQGETRISALFLAMLARFYRLPVTWFLEGAIPDAEPAPQPVMGPVLAARVLAAIERHQRERDAPQAWRPERQEPEERNALPEPPRRPRPRRHRLDGSERRERSARMRREASQAPH
jgi:transcriptional regulator with XRE-family HTH domain